MTIALDLTLPTRQLGFGGSTGEGDFVILGIDYTSRDFRMQITAEPGGPVPYVTLTMTTAGTQGISASFDAGYVHPITGAVVGATTVRIQISQATIQSFPRNADTSEPAQFFYDLWMSTGPGEYTVYLSGAFTVQPGVTS